MTDYAKVIERLNAYSREKNIMSTVHFDAVDAIEALIAERDAYQQAADKMAAEHKVERDALQAENEHQSKCATEWFDRYTNLQAKLDALQTQEQVQFLADATRFKLTFDAKGRVSTMWAHMEKLEGRWVALVAAEDDCHLKLAAPKALEPLTLLSAAFRTTVAHGLNEDYCMVFKFKDLDSLHAADDEWRKFRGAP